MYAWSLPYLWLYQGVYNITGNMEKRACVNNACLGGAIVLIYLYCNFIFNYSSYMNVIWSCQSYSPSISALLRSSALSRCCSCWSETQDNNFMCVHAPYALPGNCIIMYIKIVFSLYLCICTLRGFYALVSSTILETATLGTYIASGHCFSTRTLYACSLVPRSLR